MPEPRTSPGMSPGLACCLVLYLSHRMLNRHLAPRKLGVNHFRNRALARQQFLSGGRRLCLLHRQQRLRLFTARFLGNNGGDPVFGDVRQIRLRRGLPPLAHVQADNARLGVRFPHYAHHSGVDRWPRC